MAMHIDIDWHRAETIWLLDDLLDYLDTLEKELGNSKERDLARIRAFYCREDDEPERSTELYDHYQRFEHRLPSMLRYSFIVLLFILFEDRAKSLCLEIKKRNSSILIDLGELKGGAVERVKLFLTKVIVIFSTDSVHWKKLEILQKVRDCIVHTNGFFNDSRDREFLDQLIRKNIGINCLNQRLEIEKRFCQSILEDTISFFNNVYDAAGFKPL